MHVKNPQNPGSSTLMLGASPHGDEVPVHDHDDSNGTSEDAEEEAGGDEDPCIEPEDSKEQ